MLSDVPLDRRRDTVFFVKFRTSWNFWTRHVSCVRWTTRLMRVGIPLVPAFAAADTITAAAAGAPTEAPPPGEAQGTAAGSDAAGKTEAPPPVDPRARPVKRSNEPPPLTEAIEVTATQVERPVDESPVPVLVLQRRDLERSGSYDLSQTLSFAPGVSIAITENSARGGGPGVEIQGLSGKQVLVLLNGRPFVGDSDGVVDLAAIPTSILERIEVVSGPMSVLYGGGAIGGVINLITRQAQAGSGGPNLSTSFRYGNYNTFETSQGMAYGARTMSTLLVGNYAASDGYDLDTTLQDTDGEQYRKAYAFGSLVWQPRDIFNIRLDALYSNDDRKRIYLDIPSLELGDVYIFNDWLWAESRLFTTLSFQYMLPKLSIDGWVSSSFYHRNYQVRVQGGFKATERVSDIRDINARVQARWVPNGNFFLMGGLESRHQRLDSVATYTDADGVDSVEPEVEGATLTTGEAFLLADKTFFQGALELYGGLRLNYTQNFGFFPPSVLNIKFRPLKPLVLRGNFGLGYRPPNLKELNYRFDHIAYNYVIRGNPDLLPEYSLNSNFSAELDGGEWGMLRAGYFYNDVIQLIDFVYAGKDPDTLLDVYKTENINSVVTQGVETIGSTRVGDVRLTAAWQIMDARDKTTGLHLLRRPTNSAKLNATWILGDSGLELSGSARYQGRQFVSDGSTGSTQAGTGDGSSCVEAYEEQLAAGTGWNTALINQVESECFIDADPFMVMDLRAQSRFQVPGRPLILSFYGGVNNLTNVVRDPTLLTTDTTDANQTLDVRPMPGRVFFFGVRGEL